MARTVQYTFKAFKLTNKEVLSLFYVAGYTIGPLLQLVN